MDARTQHGEHTVYKTLLNMVVCLVDHTEDVEIAIVPGEQDTIFRMQANPLDIGKLIGKQGRTARSIRTIVSAAAMKTGRWFNVDIVKVEAILRYRPSGEQTERCMETRKFL